MNRGLDVLFAALAVVLLAPLLLATAIAVRLSLGPGIFFAQWRVGQGGRLFRIVKFRTMRDVKGPGGVVVPDQERLTGVGALLRRLSLDELPQLWNVLRGEMAIIGPRPLLPEYLPLYSKRQARRHEVRPGITGWTQVSGRNRLSWEEKLEADVWYVEHRSLILDLKILLKTAWVVIHGQGVNQSEGITMKPFTGTSTPSHEGDRPAWDIYLSPPHQSGDELKLIQEVLASNWLAPLGPQVDAFEREFREHVGAAAALAVSSGTAALHLALRLLEVKPGQDVLVSNLTFAGSVFPILYEGARPVFIDSNSSSWNLDPDLLERALREQAKAGRLPAALVLVHLYGQPAEMDAISEVCNQYGVPIVEDAAEALGATYDGKQVGSWGRASIFSFNGNKVITTSGGGMLVSDDTGLIERARKLSAQARDSAPHYEHSEVGFNYRLSNLLAAVGRAQLRVLEQRVDARRRVFQAYHAGLAGLPGVTFMPEIAKAYHSRWLTTLTIDPRAAGVDREHIRLALENERIEARPVWKPMHMQPVFSHYLTVGGSVAESLFREGLCLPSGSSLSPSEVDRVVTVVREAFSQGNHSSP